MAQLTYDQLYNQILEFYPLGIKDSDSRYQEFPGLMKMQDLSHQKMEPVAYKKWKEFVKNLKFPDVKILSASGESELFYPCYTGRFLLSKEKTGKATYKRELFVHLSVLGPYYSIYGLDQVALNIDGEEERFEPIIFVSPHGFYEKFIPLVRTKIEAEYDGIQFVSYALLSRRATRIYISGGKTPDREASIFQALFKPEDVTNYKQNGHIHYD